MDIPRKKASGQPVVLTALGSLGDVYPVLSIAKVLDRFGIQTRLALTPEDCEVARRWGLLATPVGPSQATVMERLGRSRDDLTAAVLRDASKPVNDVLIPMLSDLVAELEPLTDGAGCVAGPTFALHGALAAEKAGLPFVPLILQPMMMFSSLDPPRARRFQAMAPHPTNAITRTWNRAVMGLAQGLLRRRHLGPLNTIRTELGLSPHHGTPLLDPGPAEVPLRLGLWSERFSPKPADAPAGLEIVGFPPPPEGDLPYEVQTWLDAGPAPLVVTLGSVAQALGGRAFWSEAIALARRMGLRAVLLHGQTPVPEGDDILALPYAPHGPLFPQAAAIVHHGGIGTTAEAIRSGRPQLVVPVGGDQPDNAARLKRLGLAVTLPITRFRAAHAHKILTGLLDRFDYAAAATVGAQIAEEEGATQAAARLKQIAMQGQF
ncbi:MAG: glycosyltransferase [Pseudomonadota bacterium]